MKKIKKETIVHELLILIAQKSLVDGQGNICNVYYPLKELAEHLNNKFYTKFNSAQHLYNQLKKYEKEHNISFFKKKTQDGLIFIKIKQFHEFSHLLVLNKNIKLILANGALELLQSLLKNKEQWTLYLGEGSECYYIAQLLLDKITIPLSIYTNNLGIIQLFLNNSKIANNIQLRTRTGHIKHNTFSIIEEPTTDNFLNINFDAVFQSPRYIKDNKTCEIYSYMQKTKEYILNNAQGIKILPLTLFEFLLPEESTYEYGSVEQYDYLILPPEHNFAQVYKEYISSLNFSPYIKYVSFNIYKANK